MLRLAETMESSMQLIIGFLPRPICPIDKQEVSMNRSRFVCLLKTSATLLENAMSSSTKLSIPQKRRTASSQVVGLFGVPALTLDSRLLARPRG